MVNLYLIHMLLEHDDYHKTLAQYDFLFVPIANPGKLQKHSREIKFTLICFKMALFTLTLPTVTGTRTDVHLAITALELTSIEISTLNLSLAKT